MVPLRWLNSFLILLLLPIGAEVALRIYDGNRQLFSNWDVPKYRLDYNPSGYLENANTHIPLRLPEKLEKAFSGASPGNKIYSHFYPVIDEPTDFRIPDSFLGSDLKPNMTWHSVQKDFSGEILFDQYYHTDSHGRRIVPGQSGNSGNKNILLLGGSNTFGVGLSDDQTIAAFLKVADGSYNVFNYARDVWGLGNFLRLFSLPKFADDLNTGLPTKAIFVFHPHQIERTFGNLDFYMLSTQWPAFQPYYWIDSDGKIQTEGMLSDRYIRDNLYKILSVSRLLKGLRLMTPRGISQEDLASFAKLLKNLEDIGRQTLHPCVVITLFLSDCPEDVAKGMIEELDLVGLKSINYAGINLAEYLPGPAIQPNAHPTALAAKFYGEQIVQDFKAEP